MSMAIAAWSQSRSALRCALSWPRRRWSRGFPQLPRWCLGPRWHTRPLQPCLPHKLTCCPFPISGSREEGLRLFTEALAAFEASGQGDNLAEAYRLQGELLLRQVVPDTVR